jgi:nucleoid-associated protein YgaU
MALTKAWIELLDDIPSIPEGFIEVQFNPTEYSLNKGAQIAEIAIPGIDSPILQFIRGQNEKLTLDLFFDTTSQGTGEDAEDVTELTDKIYQLVKIQPDTHAPPRLRFIWGALSFQAIVESVGQKFTLFNPLGTPLRATLTVTFREYKTLEEQIAELNLKSADHSKQRVVQRGDTLNRIAAQEYGDSRAWRAIADLNDIANPRKLVPGTRLEIPPLDAFGTPVIKRS